MWIAIKAKRVLYVDRGVDVILCDRLHRGPVELVLEIEDMTGKIITDHACGNPHCKRIAADGQLACKQCWFRLPKKIRDVIWRTYRNHEHAAYAEAVLDARKVWAEDVNA